MADYWICKFCGAFNNGRSYCTNCKKDREEKVARLHGGGRVGVN